MCLFLSITDGRLEDGYIAWSSIYLHEYFGCTIYTPLTPEEELELKKPGGDIPRWMYEFTSLPNLAIFMSYFCIGVALQLLRTPLIVYFIEDLGATPAEVNVLFTGKRGMWTRAVGASRDCGIISHILASFAYSRQSWPCRGALKSFTAFFRTVFPLTAADASRISLRAGLFILSATSFS